MINTKDENQTFKIEEKADQSRDERLENEMLPRELLEEIGVHKTEDFLSENEENTNDVSENRVSHSNSFNIQVNEIVSENPYLLNPLPKHHSEQDVSLKKLKQRSNYKELLESPSQYQGKDYILIYHKGKKKSHEPIAFANAQLGGSSLIGASMGSSLGVSTNTENPGVQGCTSVGGIGGVGEGIGGNSYGGFNQMLYTNFNAVPQKKLSPPIISANISNLNANALNSQKNIQNSQINSNNPNNPINPNNPNNYTNININNTNLSNNNSPNNYNFRQQKEYENFEQKNNNVIKFKNLSVKEGGQKKSQPQQMLNMEIKSNNQIQGQMQNQIQNQMQGQIQNQMQNQMQSQMQNQMPSQMTNQISSQMTSQRQSQITNQLQNQMTNQLQSQLNLGGNDILQPKKHSSFGSNPSEYEFEKIFSNKLHINPNNPTNSAIGSSNNSNMYNIINNNYSLSNSGNKKNTYQGQQQYNIGGNATARWRPD